MNDRPLLFDAKALDAARKRAARIGFAGFLHAEVRAEIQERLIEVNRSFTKQAVVTGFPQDWADFGAGHLTEPTDTLDLEQSGFDLVIHALALHAANDPVGQLIQIRRALRPDGMALAALFGGRSLIELREVLTQAEAELSGGLRPRVAPMAEIRDLGGLLQRAGFALPVADSMTLIVTYENLAKLVQDLRAMGETNVLSERSRVFSRRDLFERAEEIYRAQYGDETGRLPVTVEIIFLTGWAPDASQQKPLKPGSAQMKLADALKPETTSKTDDLPD